LAATAAEITLHLEAYLGGRPIPATATFEEREPPYRALDDAALRARLEADEATMRGAIARSLEVDADAVILASGGGSSRELLEPLFDAIGKRTIWLGAAGEGSRVKVVVNSWLCSIAEGTAEMLRLAAALGLEPALVLDALEDGPLEAPYMRMKGEAMLRRDFSPSFKLRLATKDARLAADAGAAAGAEIPVIEAIAAQMEAVAAKHPDEDVAALFLGARDS